VDTRKRQHLHARRGLNDFLFLIAP
jgi:hypothetical protein